MARSLPEIEKIASARADPAALEGDRPQWMSISGLEATIVRKYQGALELADLALFLVRVRAKVQRIAA